MPVGTLKPDDADQKVVEAARLLVGNMVRVRPYMMVLDDDDSQTVIGHFHTLHDIRLYARRHELPNYSVWTQVSSSRLAREEAKKDEYEPEEYDDDEEYETEESDPGTEDIADQGEDELEEEADEEEEYEEETGPPVSDEIEDLLDTDLPDLEDGEDLEDDGVL